MIDPISSAFRIASSGMLVQSERVRIVTENMANAGSTGDRAGGDPFVRKTISFKSVVDRMTGANVVTVDRIGVDSSPFRKEYDPHHPAADDKGYVRLSNVNVLLEMADLREANRSYQANMQALKQAREMHSMTVNLLRG